MASFRVMGSGAETLTLLWTNPNPTSDFVAQTIALDLSEYVALIIKVCSHDIYQGVYRYQTNYIDLESENFYQGISCISYQNHYMGVRNMKKFLMDYSFLKEQLEQELVEEAMLMLMHTHRNIWFKETCI